MRAPYADYVNHMLRHYCTHLDAGIGRQFKTGAEERNWKASHKVIDRLNGKEKDFIFYLYRDHGNEPLDRSIRIWCKVKQKDVQETWDFLNWVSYRVAKMRGLA